MSHKGARIRQACEAVEKLGTSDYRPVAALMGISIQNAHKYCDRAVSHGLMTVDRKVRPVKYTIVEGWRDNMHEKQHKTKATPINSVFQLGAINAS